MTCRTGGLTSRCLRKVTVSTDFEVELANPNSSSTADDLMALEQMLLGSGAGESTGRPSTVSSAVRLYESPYTQRMSVRVGPQSSGNGHATR